jgi:hypothetical protein
MTELKTFEIEITGELSLEFDGISLISESNHWVNGQDRNRYHSIDIYEPSDGGYILHICFVTHWQGEHDQKEVWELGTLDQVVKILENYDPIEFLIGFPNGQHFAEKQARLEDALARDWVELKGKVLNSLGIKRTRGKGQPQHPLGACRNPGWSIPEKLRLAVDAEAERKGIKTSEAVTKILQSHFNF